MTAKAGTANRYVFLYFTVHLFVLQFMAGGLHAYFSIYVLKQWLFSGYLLYGALIYLFAMYSLALLRKKQFVTGVLQLISLLALVGIMVYPFYSLDHVSLLPFLAALQPIILFSDYNSAHFGNLQHVRGTIWNGVIILIFVSPVIIALMIFPIVEKIIIYCDAALLFARLQLKVRDDDNAQRGHYITG